MEFLHELFEDSEFWVLVAFLIAVGFLIYKVRGMVTGRLDQRGAKIKAEIDEASRLAEEAQQALARHQRRQRDAIQEAEAIIAQAGDEALRAAEEAKRDLAASLERRKRMAVEKLALDEQKAIQDVRNTAVDVAIAAVRHVLAHDLDAKRRANLIDEAIAALPETLH